MTTADAQQLIDYHYWARDRVLDAVAALTPEQFKQDMKNSFKSVRDTCVHTYSAEWIWHSRWTGASPSEAIPFDRFPDVASMRAAWVDLESHVRELIGGMGDGGLNRDLDYRLLNGTPGRSSIAQVLQHVVNHASYHRGQVTTMLRQLGASPAKSMDMIAFFRERA